MTASAVVQGLGVGLMVSLLFALVPLLEVRTVKPLLLIRGLKGWPGRAERAANWRAIDWAIVWTTVGITVAVTR